MKKKFSELSRARQRELINKEFGGRGIEAIKLYVENAEVNNFARDYLYSQYGIRPISFLYNLDLLTYRSTHFDFTCTSILTYRIYRRLRARYRKRNDPLYVFALDTIMEKYKVSMTLTAGTESVHISTDEPIERISDDIYRALEHRLTVYPYVADTIVYDIFADIEEIYAKACRKLLYEAKGIVSRQIMQAIHGKFEVNQ